MRIIAGRFKGRKLASIKGDNIRPTADKIREALFNIIGSEIIGRTVLDIFAGTGAMGLEALSRGAELAVFIDNNIEAIHSINKNIAICGAEKESLVLKKDCSRKMILKESLLFDLVFADPPYKINNMSSILNNLKKSVLLADNASILFEHSADYDFSENIENMIRYDKRKYGRAAVSFFEYKNIASSP